MSKPSFQQHPGFGPEFQGPVPPIVSEWTQQPQPQQNGVVVLRDRALELAGVNDRGAAPSNGETITGSETAPESMRAFAIGNKVRRIRMVQLAESGVSN